MTDPRTEARRRIAAAIYECSTSEMREPLYQREADAFADAVLKLFPESTWATTWTNGHLTMAADLERATHRQLMLAGPVEPVVPEEPAG